MMTDYNIHTYKDYWRNAWLIPSKAEDKQLPFLIDTLRKELDLDKIESILDVGCGYGRLAKQLIKQCKNLRWYHGIDISKSAVESARKYVTDNDLPYIDFDNTFLTIDFDDVDSDKYPRFCDLVISVETMSVIPDTSIIRSWIYKMTKLSKKYIVNLDFTRGNDTITNTPPHDYYGWHNSLSSYITVKEIEIPNSKQSIFVVRVR